MISTILYQVVSRIISSGNKVFFIRMECFQSQSNEKSIHLSFSSSSRNINPNSLSCGVFAISRFMHFSLTQKLGVCLSSVVLFFVLFWICRKKKNIIVNLMLIIMANHLRKLLSIFLSFSFHILCLFKK